MYTIARTSSSSSMQHTVLPYHPYHHAPAYASTSQPLLTPGEPLTPSYPFSAPTSPGAGICAEPATGYLGSRVGAPSTPGRGCLKAPTKEFIVAPEPLNANRDITPSSASKNVPKASRRRPNMQLDRLPSNAIARIQLADGVEPYEVKNATGSGVAARNCKQRVLTPYVKSDKGAWLSDGEE
jgi:hypothetical protein